MTNLIKSQKSRPAVPIYSFIPLFSLITKLIASSKMNSSVYNINHRELILGLRYKKINLYFIQLMALNSNQAATLYVYYQMKDTQRISLCMSHLSGLNFYKAATECFLIKPIAFLTFRGLGLHPYYPQNICVTYGTIYDSFSFKRCSILILNVIT